MAPKSKINCIKCVKLLTTTKDNLACSKCDNSLHRKCSRLKCSMLKRILKIQRKEKQNLFANFALTTLVLNVTGMLSMVRKEFYVLIVIFEYIKNVQELPRLNTKILETIQRNLRTLNFSLFHTKITVRVTKSLHEDCGLCYLHLHIFSCIYTLLLCWKIKSCFDCCFPQ